MATLITGIDASTLLSFYQAKSGTLPSATSGSGSGAATVAPTPPWSSASTATPQSALTQAVLAGSRFINTNAAQLGVQTANASDYKSLFALYQGLSALQGIANSATKTTLSLGEQTSLQSRFAAGMKEVESYLASAPFSAFTVAQGKVSASQQTTTGVKREADTYQTQPLFTGTLADAVPAFQGDVKFDLSLAKPSGAATDVAFDLSEMGDTLRTMSNVTLYLNGKLEAAGVQTRFANVRIPAVAQTVKSGTSTITLPAGKDSFALKLVGSSAETPTFSAPAATPAVYVASTSGRTAAQASTALPADATLQLAKFDGGQSVETQDDGTTKIFGHTLPTGVATVRSTVTGADGSLYVLADVTGTTSDGQTIKGSQDTALIKYDSAGALQYTRTLGASDSASGYALAVSSDGKSVALAGTTTKPLDGAGGISSSDGSQATTFTSVFNAATGEESWTTQRTGTTGDTPTAVSFGADGSVYVVGKTPGTVLGGTAVGGGDSWLQAFSPRGAATYTSQFGSTSADKAAGVSADADGVIVASVENGHAVLRRFDLDADGKLQAGAVRDLGDLQGGDIAGIGRADDGSILIAGSTHNGALDAGTVTTAYGGGREAFVAGVGSDLSTSSGDTLSYVDLGADANTSAMTVSGGQVYLTGQLVQSDGKTLGYAAAVDPTTGALGWHDTMAGADGLSAPSAIAVAATGASVLDKLGLPTGKLSFAGSQTLVANTSLRAGDQFYVRSGTGSKVPVTVEAADTLATLATKINRALSFTGKAETEIVDGHDQLKITPLNGRKDIQIEAGTAGRDALAALGLTEGLLVADDSSTTSKTTSTATPKTYGLKLPTTLSIANAAAAKSTGVLLSSAMTALQLAYSDLAFPAHTTTSKASASGPVPAYLTDQISNYQLALARLTGSG